MAYSHKARKRWRLQVAVREREWNQPVAANRPVLGSRCGNAAVAACERVENTALEHPWPNTLRSVVRQGSELRSDRWRGTAWP